MTAKEAISQLQERVDFISQHYAEDGLDDYNEAIELAIEALNHFAGDSKKVSAEGQHKKDLISKADVCEILADVFPTDGEKVVYVEEIENAYQEIIALPYIQPFVIHCTDCEDWYKRQSVWNVVISELPSAQPEKRTEERTETHACDSISREAAIDAIKKSRFLVDAMEKVIKLPSAQPEIEERMSETEQNVPNDDFISRKRAIDAIEAVFPIDPMKSEYAQGIACGAALAKTYVEQLPSAQPEPCEDKLKEIAEALSEKMCYMNTCLNERDIILGYLGVKRPSETHCNSDCRNEKCESYHYATKKLPSVQPEKRTEERTETHACDLIDRQALMKEFSDFVRASNNSDFARTPIWNDAVSLVESMPSAQPERKKGTWSFIGDNMFECTCCGTPYTTQQLNGLRNYNTDPYAPKFCPNCGADMRGEQNE